MSILLTGMIVVAILCLYLFIPWPCPKYSIGQQVVWVEEAKSCIHTRGPMTVVGWYYQHRNKVCSTPGWVYRVSFPADSVDYYDPPLSFYFGPIITSCVHEKWLTTL